MIEMTAQVRNAEGIHCRPSAEIVQAAAGCEGEISVSMNGRMTDLRSMQELVFLELVQGDEVRIAVSGPDEEAVCRQLVALFERHFDFPPESDHKQDQGAV